MVFRIFLFSPSEENDPKRRQMRLHRSVSILTVVFSRPLLNRRKHHRRRLSRSSPRLLSSRSSEEGSKSTICVSSVGPNGDFSVFSCLLRQTSVSVLFASPPSSLLKPVIYRIKLPGPAIIGEVISIVQFVFVIVVLLPVNKRGLLHSPKTDLCQKVSSFELDDSLVHCVLPRFEVEDGAVQREEVRRECGKGFTSSKALCGHMACHFEREKRVKKSVKSSVISHGLV
ncbi:LOW QUALITY PROTEIN: hypothetical protein HID58_015792 [Brassica napus]|uniref:C2H2-type domain-containing protein n=1 Tax=Brassica napus TaxID=3708 RepID=A0ABQ8DL37_BRANA|nr:LOW QUALITY PROTEIN: hypothetical protein HID58_015792 [Brassica napus]